MANRFLGLGSGKSGAIALGSYTQTWYSCSGSSGATSLSVTGTFSPGDRLFIHQTRGTGVGAYEDNTVASYTAGTITLVHPLLATYTDSGASQAQVAVVKEASSVTGSFTVSAWDGDKGGIFVMACNGTFSGTINATGKGFRGADGRAQKTNGYQGEGTSGAANTESFSANGNGGGGGKGGGTGTSEPMGGGGGGGNAVAGSSGGSYLSGTAGSGGSLVGQANLSTGIFFGGGGGGGGNGDNSDSNSPNQPGGTGGGIIVVYANKISSATLTANGTNGSSGNTGSRTGSGGGAGGTILLKSVSVSGSTINATAGSGGSALGWATGASGGAGSVGRIRIESCSLSGTTSPTASTQTGGFNYCGTNIAIL